MVSVVGRWHALRRGSLRRLWRIQLVLQPTRHGGRVDCLLAVLVRLNYIGLDKAEHVGNVPFCFLHGRTTLSKLFQFLSNSTLELVLLTVELFGVCLVALLHLVILLTDLPREFNVVLHLPMVLTLVIDALLLSVGLCPQLTHQFCEVRDN